VRLALNLKKIDYISHPVHLRKGEQKDPHFVSTVNPAGLVPALKIDGNVMTESMAICEYLEETR